MNQAAEAPWTLYSKGRRWSFLAIVFLVGASSYLDKNIVGVVLEPIKAEYHISDTQLGLLSGLAFALVYAGLGIPVAAFADRGNRKHVLSLSLLVWSVMTALCGMVSGFWQLAAARFGVGAGEAGAIPPAQSLLADYFPPADRAGAIGIFMMSSAAGYALALGLGGWIAEHHGWRAVFLYAGLFGLLLVPLAHWGLNEPRQHPRRGANRRMAGEGIARGLRRLWAKPAYRLMLAAITVYYLMSYGAMVFIVSMLIRIHGLGIAEAGSTFGVIAAVSAVLGNFGGGWLANRLAARALGWLPRLAGWGLIAVAPLFQLALGLSSLAAMLPLLLIAMTGLSATIPAMFAGIHAVCGSPRRALAVAVLTLCSNFVGLGLGPVITGGLSDAFAIRWGMADGLRIALIIMTAALYPAGMLMLCAQRHITDDRED